MAELRPLSAPQLAFLLERLTDRKLDLSYLEELTIEANPGDLDRKDCCSKDSPVNRVPLGVQTFNDRMLKQIVQSLGKGHLWGILQSQKLVLTISRSI